MALSSTIYKADLQISNMDSHYYQDHHLTIAKHPSETEERLMVRLVTFALFAHEALCFGNGLSNKDEPDLWLKDLTGNIDLWIDVGMPDERQIRKACGLARQVVVVLYGGNRAELWWKQNQSLLIKKRNLKIISLADETTKKLESICSRKMQFNCTIEDGQLWLINDSATISIDPIILHQPE
jgi:uncharacterized protein YaeQ